MKCNYVRTGKDQMGGSLVCHAPLTKPKTSYDLTVIRSTDRTAPTKKKEPMTVFIKRAEAMSAPPGSNSWPTGEEGKAPGQPGTEPVPVGSGGQEERAVAAARKKESAMARFSQWLRGKLAYAALFLWVVAVGALIYALE
jgi:hypothetical protein